MSWRTVVIQSKCKLSYKNHYLMIRNDTVNMVHLSEIHTLVIDTTTVSITSMAISEILKRKIKIIFCDEKHQPQGEIVQYYGAHNTSKRVIRQTKWDNQTKGEIWAEIIKNKIYNQYLVLKKHQKDGAEKLIRYIEEVKWYDSTNREGHTAKVYFNSLFGKNFLRGEVDEVNSGLNYGYSILLSAINREIVNCGYITQLGIMHKSEYNCFNLGCDLVEVFRPVVDDYVYTHKEEQLDEKYKMGLINLLNTKIKIDDSQYFLTNAISLYVLAVTKALEEKNKEKILTVEVV